MDVDEEKRRGRGADQSLEGRWSFKENIGIKACLPARCAAISSRSELRPSVRNAPVSREGPDM